MREEKTVLEVQNIKKHFGGVQALRGVDFKLFEKETVALMGDNGAGKSTLIKCISGVYLPDEGDIFIHGEKVNIKTPSDARKEGIETVYQDLSLAGQMDLISNMFLGRELIKLNLGIMKILDRKAMEARTRKALESIGVSTVQTLKTETRNLSGGQRQALALSRAVSFGVKILILDEPTAAMGIKESRKIIDLILRLKEQEIPMILISHSVPIVFEVSDRIVIMRQGQIAGELRTADANHEDIVSLMVGVGEGFGDEAEKSKNSLE